jgi:hypothetical protein
MPCSTGISVLPIWYTLVTFSSSIILLPRLNILTFGCRKWDAVSTEPCDTGVALDGDR